MTFLVCTACMFDIDSYVHVDATRMLHDVCTMTAAYRHVHVANDHMFQIRILGTLH